MLLIGSRQQRAAEKATGLGGHHAAETTTHQTSFYNERLSSQQSSFGELETDVKMFALKDTTIDDDFESRLADHKLEFLTELAQAAAA